MKDRVLEEIKTIVATPIENNKKIRSQLEFLLSELIAYNSQLLGIKEKKGKLKISLQPIEEKFNVDLGVERKKGNELIVPDWIFKIDTRIKNFLIEFIVIKESIMQFLEFEYTKLDLALVNILTIIWVRDFLGINSIMHSFFKSINSRIYSEEIPNITHQQLRELQNLVFIKNITFKELFGKYQELRKASKELMAMFQKFKEWIYSFIKTEDVVAPIYFSERFIPILNLLIELGYENASPYSMVPLLKERYGLSMHPNTVRKYFRDLSENYSILWRVIINYDKLNLHNYFVKIKTKSEKHFKKLIDDIGKIPYLKSLYSGRKDDEYLIYSPTLICPHIVSEQINDKLTSQLKKKLITDYNLLLIHDKRLFTSLLTQPFNPKIDFFKELLKESEEYPNLHKHTFSYEKYDFSTDFDFYEKKLDVNLLYFLSIIRNSYLIKSSHNFITSELEKLYEMNDIKKSDVETRNYFLGQIEIRARRRELMDYSLLLQKYRPVSMNTLVFEIPTVDMQTQEPLQELIRKLQVFSFLGQITTSNKGIFMIPGLSVEHPIKDLIEGKIAKEGFESNFYTINHVKSKYMPLHELYNFEEQKWRIF